MLQLFHMGWLNIVNFRYLDFQTAHQSGYFDFLKPQLAGQRVRERVRISKKIMLGSDNTVVECRAQKCMGLW